MGQLAHHRHLRSEKFNILVSLCCTKSPLLAADPAHQLKHVPVADMAATSQHYYYLGMVDERVGTESTSWQTNKVGGLPDWTTSALRSLPDLQCPLCSRNMLLVIQIYSPLEKSEWYHRTIYIFCCINPSCWNKQESWKVVRSQERSSQAEETTVPGSSKASLSCDWLEGQDDWGDDGAQPDELSPQKTCGINTQSLEAGLGSLSVAPGGVASASSPLNREDPYDCEMEEETAVEPEPLQSGRALEAMEVLKRRERDHKQMLSNLQQPSAFKSFYISVVEESEIPPGETAVDIHARKLLQEYELGEGNAFRIPSGQGCMTYAQELYEKAYHNDVVFHRFHKRVRRYPQQLMRFCWEGEPLFICPPPPSWEPKNCEACGARRCFELQAMPALIPSLKIEGIRKLRDAPVEFGTVLIYSCSASCWKDGEDRKSVV